MNTDVLHENELGRILTPLGANFFDYFHKESLHRVSSKMNTECLTDMAEVANGISSQKVWALKSKFFHTN